MTLDEKPMPYDCFRTQAITDGFADAKRHALHLAIFVCVFATSAQAQYLLADGTEVAPLDLFHECDVCPEMIVLPMGDFLMGAPEGESQWEGTTPEGETFFQDIGDDERPVHRVEIDIPIAMGRNEVTRDQWMACVAAGGCNGYVPRNWILGNPDVFGDNNVYYVEGSSPVIFVSYLDAVAYTDWLNEMVGADVYRVPTEAEWEYAARAGTTTRFAQGDTITFDQANFNARDADPPRPWTPLPVEMLDAANAWGLRHMSGNVIEQTSSCYSEVYEGLSTSSQYLAQSEVSGCPRTTRGGAYNADIDFLRTAQRGVGPEDWRSRYKGFRVVREFD